ncbi:MAG: hypothetical protein HOV97_05020 [Nonomuraea sp.]|nr:hypothetical protein [Nonomuraea sp.]
MRNVPVAMTDRWKAQAKIGDQKPTVRATIQVANLHRFDYDTAWAAGGSYETDRHRRGVFTSMIFGDRSQLREVRNILTFSWERSVDQDVATATMTILNSEIQPIGNPDEGNPTVGAMSADMPGYYTYNRGQQAVSANRWGYDTETGWQDIYVPDRLVKTYEGYGQDPSVAPELDPNLLPSGVWLIDKVTYDSGGTITLEMRDLGRLLLQQIVFPPVIPYAEYPLSWSKIQSAQVPSRDCVGGTWTGDDLRPIASASSSNDFYVGQGLTNHPFPNYVGPNGGVQGHRAGDALRFDNQFDTTGVGDKYWLSTGQDGPSAKVWWQADFNDPFASVGAVRIAVKGGPYRVYISVHDGTKWIGKKKIPYAVGVGDVDVKADIPFVQTAIMDRSSKQDVILRRSYRNVKKIRVTFTHLENNVVGEHSWQAGLRYIRVYAGAGPNSLSFSKGTITKQVGNYRDYTDIVKWVCAWGGFYWPPHASGQDFIRATNDGGEAGLETITYVKDDPVLPKGRVWGDLMKSGTAGVSDLTVDQFDKKPLMDIVNYVRDLLGFIFLVDETGGVVWRLPNIGLDPAVTNRLGNYLSPTHAGVYTRARTSDIVTIDEDETLLSYSTTLNSENVRERLFVANVTGKIGTVIRGFNPYPVGLRRIAGWTDQNFKSKADVRVMADMLNARSMFEYRRASVTIPGYPAIQVDDQVRIFERVTNETYYHYVLGIRSEINMSEGTWEYALDTHWLGERPSDAWVVKVDQLDQVTQNYLNLTGGPE